MTITERMPSQFVESSDAALVSDTLAGDRTAFEQIVARYQSLICSVAYSATGNVTESEDLAQETFLTAWKQLPDLREPAKLRAWICGIARYTVSNALRRRGREPSHGAESLDSVTDTCGADQLPADRAMSAEEQAILWRAIAHIPEIYREPLILYYREQQSVEAVAGLLGLSGDAVKQRLSRGRKLLQQEVLTMVESGLAGTKPGRAFTVGVLTALPALLLPAQAAAAVGVVAAKGTAKTALGSSGIAAALLGSIVAIFGTWVGYRMDLDSAGSDAERQLTKSFYRRLFLGLAVFFVMFGALMFVAGTKTSPPALLVSAFVGVGVSYAAFVGCLMFWWFRVRGRFLANARASQPVVRTAWEYLSPVKFCGLPLVHIRIGGDLIANRNPVRAWFAVGDTAIGGLFAFGGIAMAPVSIGGCAIGILPFGGAAAGVLALGGFSLGVWSFGGLAIGWQAFGGCAIAWSASAGAAAIARDFALGGSAYAAEANNVVARAFIEGQAFFKYASHVFRHYMAWINFIWVIPMLIWWRVVRRSKAQSASASAIGGN